MIFYSHNFFNFNFHYFYYLVAEKESLSGDKEMLMQQLTNANTESETLKESIIVLKQKVLESTLAAKNTVNNMIENKEISVKKEKNLMSEIEKMKTQNLQLVNELDRAGSELMESLKGNTQLSENLNEIIDDLSKEKIAREKDHAAVQAALKHITGLTDNLDELKLKDIERENILEKITIERENALDKIAVLERNAESLRYDNFALQEEVMVVRGELDELDEKHTENLLLLETLEIDKREYETGEEITYLHEKVRELKDAVNSLTEASAATVVVNTVRLGSCQKEIERLALDLSASQNEIKNREDDIILLRNEFNVKWKKN